MIIVLIVSCVFLTSATLCEIVPLTIVVKLAVVIGGYMGLHWGEVGEGVNVAEANEMVN